MPLFDNDVKKGECRSIVSTRFGLMISAAVFCGLSLHNAAWAEDRPAREVGCVADNKDADPLGIRGHDLDGAAFKDPKLTVKQCLRLCSEQGFKYAGLQNGSWCFCGNSYGKYKGGAARCTTKCAGDESEICGGESANSVWEFKGSGYAVRPRKEDSLSTVAAPAEPAQTKPEHVHRAATVIPVGKWPEGLGFDGTNLWVAESGQRRIARIDMAARRVTRRVKVGRLPVDIVSGSLGRVFALVHTDKKVWLQKGKSGETLARVPACPNAMAGNEDMLYVLAWGNCVSSEVHLYEIGIESRKVRKIADLSSNSHGIAKVENTVWTTHLVGSGTTISRVNPQSKQVAEFWLYGSSLYRIVSNDDRIFLSGYDGNQGVVIAFDNQQYGRFHKQTLPERITALAATSTYLAAFGDGGSIWVLSAKDLGFLRLITTDFGPFEAKAAFAWYDTLYVTTFRGQGQNGSVIVIDNWQPSNRQIAAESAPTLPAKWGP